MSVVIVGHHHGNAIFTDDNGPARLPLDSLARLHGLADRSANARVTVLGRRYDRDDLGAVLRDYDNGSLPELDTCSVCHDEPAPFDLADARPVGPNCYPKE